MNRDNLKKLILCADDFGIAPGVNRAILDLIKAGRLNATSCMTCIPDWSNGVSELKRFNNQIQIGLHLTLTDQNSLATMLKLAPDGKLPNLGKLLKLAVTRRLDRGEILEEFQRQYDVFRQALGQPPDFFDGHHHVHQFPVIRGAVIKLIRQNSKSNAPWVRVCWESPARLVSRGESIGRALSIGIFGLTLKRFADLHGIPHNAGFTGVYNYRRRLMDEELVSRLLYRAVDGTVMFCHPGIVDTQLASVDELTHAREAEYKFLLSTEFEKVLDHRGFTLYPESTPLR